MDPVFIAIFMVLLGGVLLKGTERVMSRTPAIPTKYDPHYTRKLEQQEFGYMLTTCEDDDCKECFPKALPQPPKGSAGVVRVNTCHRCGDKLYSSTRDTCMVCTRVVLGERKHPKCSVCKIPVDSDGWCSNGCTRALSEKIDQIQQHFEDQLIKSNYIMPIIMSAEPQYKIIDGYRVRIPDGVPENAHVAPEYSQVRLSDTGYLIWKWTDPDTGNQMFYKSPAPLKVGKPEFDYADKPIKLRTPEYNDSKRPRAIGTERIRK